MILVEIVRHICDGVSVGFLQEVGGGISHSDYSICDVGEVELLSVVGSFLFGASH